MNHGAIVLLGLLLLPSQLCAGDAGQSIAELCNLGYVVVSPKGPTDGGDFGPNTPGTRTAGWQEAVNFALADHRDVFIVGGQLKGFIRNSDGVIVGADGPVCYLWREPLYVPPAENLRIVGGNYVVGSDFTDDMVIIDSQKNSHFELALFVGAKLINGKAVIKIKPEKPRPDGVIGVTNSFISAIGTCGGGSAIISSTMVDPTGTAVQLDASCGPIAFNKIFVAEMNGHDTGVLLDKGDIRNNWIDVSFNHLGRRPVVVKAGSYNRITSFSDVLGIDTSPPPTGVDISGGSENIFKLIFNNGGFDRRNAIVFGSEARDNVVYAFNLPADSIANNSSSPTNRVIPLKSLGFKVETPTFPASSAWLENRSSFTVVADIESPGDVSVWTLVDGRGESRTFKAGLYPGQRIYIEPGEKVSFNYTQAPTWNWREMSGGVPSWSWRALVR